MITTIELILSTIQVSLEDFFICKPPRVIIILSYPKHLGRVLYIFKSEVYIIFHVKYNQKYFNAVERLTHKVPISDITEGDMRAI